MCLTLMLKAARHVHDAAWPRTKKGVYSLYRQPGIEQEGKRTVSLASLPDLHRWRGRVLHPNGVLLADVPAPAERRLYSLCASGGVRLPESAEPQYPPFVDATHESRTYETVALWLRCLLPHWLRLSAALTACSAGCA